MTSCEPSAQAGSTLNITPERDTSTMAWTTTAMLGSVVSPCTRR